MKKNILILCSLLFWSNFGYSQFNWKNLELEAGPSAILYYKDLGSQIKPALVFFTEIRYHFEDTPIDCGFHYGGGIFTRDWRNYQKDYGFSNYLLVGDYNFRQHKNVSPYMGIGIGFSFQTSPVSETGRPSTTASSPCLKPRIGIEFFRFVRLSASYQYMMPEFSNFECSLGIVFGGWGKR